MKRRVLLIGLLLIAVPLLASAAAQEHAAPAGKPADEAVSHEGGGSGMTGKIINFAILFGGLFFLLRKPFLVLLEQRTKTIEGTLAEAEEGRRAAEHQLEEARRKAAALESEIARLKIDAEADGRKEKERIRDWTDKEAERLRTLARQEIDAHLKAGIRELKAATAELAVGLAEARLKSHLTAADQAALIDKSIVRLQTLNEESDPR
jgi:F-type H+-transporting ATPase subunit b